MIKKKLKSTSAYDKCSASFTIVFSDRCSCIPNIPSLLFPFFKKSVIIHLVCSEYVPRQGSQIRFACYEGLVRKNIWLQCWGTALQDIRERCQIEKIERKVTGRSQLGQQWHTLNGYYIAALEKKPISAVLFAFCLDLKSRCGSCFFLPWTYLFAEAKSKYVHIAHQKWTLYVNRGDPLWCSLLFSAGLGL